MRERLAAFVHIALIALAAIAAIAVAFAVTSRARTSLDFVGRPNGGPTRIRTWNQGIREPRSFPTGADYLFTRSGMSIRWWGAGRSSL